jgi:integrase
VGGRESSIRYGGTFRTQREARERKAWVAGELAALRVPSLGRLDAGPAQAPTLRDAAKRWQSSRVDVRDATTTQHRTALNRVLPVLGSKHVDELTSSDVAEFVGKLAAKRYARESIRKSLTALAMVLDFAEISPNPARNRVHVRLPLAEPTEPEPPTAETVEAAARLLTPSYRLGLLVLDATGCRVGELEAARIGDLDEHNRAWLIRASVAKTRRARWVELPDDLWAALMATLPPREDRDPHARLFGDVTGDRLRTAIGRVCNAAGVPRFSPHALRARRVSLLHKSGATWTEIGALVGQRSRVVTADRYSFVLGDYREVERSQLLRA